MEEKEREGMEEREGEGDFEDTVMIEKSAEKKEDKVENKADSWIDVDEIEI